MLHLIAYYVWSLNSVNRFKNLVLRWKRPNCKTKFFHRKQIDNCYEQIVRSIPEASQDFLYDRETKFTPVPGWNKYCKERYSEAPVALIEWISEGKARFGDKFNRMKETRKIFVISLNYCKKNRDRISNGIIVTKFRERKRVLERSEQ